MKNVIKSSSKEFPKNKYKTMYYCSNLIELSLMKYCGFDQSIPYVYRFQLLQEYYVF